MTARYAHKSLTLGVLAITLGGCGGEEGPKIVPVDGVVNVDGKPLEGAMVRFVPASGPNESTTGVGGSNSSGKYRLRSRYGAGVAPGKYKVVISFLEAAGPGTKPGDSIEGDRILATIQGRARQKYPAYADFNSTPLAADVPEAGGSFDFNIDSKKAAIPEKTIANPRRRR